MDISSLQVLINGGPVAIGAYVITSVAKKWIPPRWRTLFATAIGLIGFVVYNALTGSVGWIEAATYGIGGGFAASGLHEAITKGLKGQ